MGWGVGDVHPFMQYTMENSLDSVHRYKGHRDLAMENVRRSVKLCCDESFAARAVVKSLILPTDYSLGKLPEHLFSLLFLCSFFVFARERVV